MVRSTTKLPRQAPEPTATEPVARRQMQLLGIVREQGFCTIGELARLLGVSEMTVRRDIARIEPDAGVRAVHGGVTVLAPQALNGSGSFSSRASFAADSKVAIGRYAAERTPYGRTLAIDAGTTTLQLGNALPLDLTGTVITHSVPLIRALMRHQSLKVLCPGGVLHADSESFEGPITLAALANLHIDVLYLAATSISPTGIYCGNDYDAVTKRSLIDIADRVVLLADSTKFSQTAMVRICTLDRLDEVITDDGVAPRHVAMVEAAGAHVSVVER